MSQELNLDALAQHAADLRRVAEVNQSAADEIDVECYEPDDPADIQAGLEFQVERDKKSADVIESLIARIRELERAQPAGEAVAWVRMTDSPLTKDSFTANPQHVADWAEMGIYLTPLYAAPPAAANQAGIPKGWKITPDEEGWGIVSPSGDGCYLFDMDSLHGQQTMESVAIREVFRQLCSSLAYPDAAPHTESHALGGGDTE